MHQLTFKLVVIDLKCIGMAKLEIINTNCITLGIGTCMLCVIDIGWDQNTVVWLFVFHNCSAQIENVQNARSSKS